MVPVPSEICIPEHQRHFSCYYSGCQSVQQEVFMPIAQMLLPEFDMEMANTRKMLERVPDGKLGFKPHEKSMGLAHLAGHGAQLVGFTNLVLTQDGMDFTGDHKPFVPESRENLLEVFDRSVADARPLLAAATDEQLTTPWTLKVYGKELFT